MTRLRLSATLAAALFMAAPALAQGAASQPLTGVWRNPKNSVHVEIRPCGPGACGYVVWANEKAKADAREGGTRELVGLQLFRNFTPEKSGAWRGKVFVPDLNATFTGTAQLIDANSLRARGCLFAGIGCKSQVWKRIEG
jgi:uncharacterized protein (DUF2147 family)